MLVVRTDMRLIWMEMDDSDIWDLGFSGVWRARGTRDGAGTGVVAAWNILLALPPFYF